MFGKKFFFSVDGQKRGVFETIKQTRTFVSWLGLSNEAASSTATALALTTSGGCNMDKDLQALLTLLPVLAAVVQFNSACYNATTSYHKLLFDHLIYN